MSEIWTQLLRQNHATPQSSLSVEQVIEQTQDWATERPTQALLTELCDGEPILQINQLCAGYGAMEILHGMDLCIGRGQSLCLVGPNGAGKSTVLHTIFGFADVYSGNIQKQDDDIRRLSASQMLSQAKIAYILQDNSVFPEMTVTENLNLGGYCLAGASSVKQAITAIYDKYPSLAQRRNQLAGSLSGGERRLLEISRALILQPEILLIDEPSIGLEPRYIDMVFEMLSDLQRSDGKTIIMVEQNAKKGLEFADLGYVLVSGMLVKADLADNLLQDPEMGRLFLGG